MSTGFVQRRFVWPLLFAPLWGTLFVSFGIGPIVTRVDVSPEPLFPDNQLLHCMLLCSNYIPMLIMPYKDTHLAEHDIKCWQCYVRTGLVRVHMHMHWTATMTRGMGGGEGKWGGVFISM